MKISLSALEYARKNPNAFRQQRISGESPFWPGESYAAYIRNGILAFHRKGLTEPQVIDSMEAKFQAAKKLNSRTRMNQAIECFQDYVADFEVQQNQSTDTRVPLVVTMPPECEQYEVKGTLYRLDMTKDGTLAAWQFCSGVADWRSELRFPLIQSTLATSMDFDLEEVSVGVYCFQTSQHVSFKYNQQQVDAAYAELCQLLPQL